MEEFFSKIEQHHHKNLPFVVYRKPGNERINAFLQNSNGLHTTTDFKTSGFVFAPFESSSKTVLIPADESIRLTCEAFIYQDESKPKLSPLKTSLQSKDEHLALVQRGIDAIQQSLLEKVVLSRIEKIKVSNNDPISVFKQLLHSNNEAFVYCWYHPNVGTWLGATPETLIRVQGKQFKTMALAGTKLYENSLDVDWQQKESEEQQFVTDFILDALKDVASNISISEPKSVRAGNLLHLRTDINGLINTDIGTVLECLHPTPAVCGLPVDLAKTFISKHESYNREYYTGFLGELNLMEAKSRNTNRRNVENNAYGSIRKMSNLYVNLRCLQIQNNDALIYVGGGITKASNPISEWEETVSKSKTMSSILSDKTIKFS